MTRASIVAAFEAAGLFTEAGCFSCDEHKIDGVSVFQVVFADFAPIWVDDEEALNDMVEYFQQYGPRRQVPEER